MNNPWHSLAISLTAVVTFAGCGNNSGNGTPESELAALVDSIQLSLPEASGGHYNAETYIENAASFRMTDTDGNDNTVVSADGRQFTSPDLNITISGSDISYSAGYVETATTYRFALVGLDSYGHSLELNATVEVTDRPSELAALENSVALSAPEKSAGNFYADDYIANATAFRMADTDENNATSVSADGRQFTSPDLNITIADSNISYVAGNVPATTAYSFVLVGLDDYGHSLELNATFEIVDEADDAPTVLKNIEVPQRVATTSADFSVQATAIDPGGMQQVTVELFKDGTLLDSRYGYPDTNLSRVDVNESFSSDGEGNYTVTFTALGIVDGEGNRSVATASRSFEISLTNDLLYLLNNVTALLNGVAGPLGAEEITALLDGIGTALSDFDTQLSAGEIDAILGDIETALNGVAGGNLDAETVDAIIETLNNSLSGLLSTLLGL